MKDILAIVNRRGGVGKTATAHALGAGLSLKGYRVLYVDMDSQSNLTYDLGAEMGPPGVNDVLLRALGAAEAIQHAPGGDILAADQRLTIADEVLQGTGKEYRLKEALQAAGDQYDYAIIDTPPALGVLTVNALTAATKAIIPAQAEIHSLQGIYLLQEAIGAVQTYTNPSLKVEGILITRYNARANLSQGMRKHLEEKAAEMGTKVFKTPVRECTALKEAQYLQRDIFGHAPRSNAAKDYAAVLEELEGREP